MHIVKLQMLPFPGILILDTRLSCDAGYWQWATPMKPQESTTDTLRGCIAKLRCWLATLTFSAIDGFVGISSHYVWVKSMYITEMVWNCQCVHESPPPDPSQRPIQLLSVWVASCLISLNLCDAIYRSRTFVCIFFTRKKGIGMKMEALLSSNMQNA